jgi:hypothetical protein
MVSNQRKTFQRIGKIANDFETKLKMRMKVRVKVWVRVRMRVWVKVRVIVKCSFAIVRFVHFFSLKKSFAQMFFVE